MGINERLKALASSLDKIVKRAGKKDENEFDYEDPFDTKDDKDGVFDEEVDIDRLLEAPKEEFIELLQATDSNLSAKDATLQVNQILDSIKATFGETGEAVEDAMILDAVEGLAKIKKSPKSNKKETKLELGDPYTQRLYDTLNDPEHSTSFLRSIFGSYIPTALLRKHLKLGMKRVVQIDPVTGETVRDEKGKPKYSWDMTSNFVDWQNNGKHDPLFQEFFAQLYKSVGALALSGAYRMMARKMSKEGLSQVSDNDFSISAIVNSILYGIKADDPLTRPEQSQIEQREEYRKNQGDNFLGDMDEVTFEGWLDSQHLTDEEKPALRKKRQEQIATLSKSSLSDQSTSLLAKIQSYATSAPKGRCSLCQNSMWAADNALFPNCTPMTFNHEILPRIKQGLIEESVVTQWRSNPFDLVNNVDLGAEGRICGGLLAEGKNRLADVMRLVRESDNKARALGSRKDKMVVLTLPDIDPDLAKQRAELLDKARQTRQEVDFDVHYTTKQFNVLREDFETIKHLFCGASKKNKDFVESRPLYKDVTSCMHSVMARLTKTDKKDISGTVEEFRCPSVLMTTGEYLMPEQVAETTTTRENEQELSLESPAIKGTCSGLIRKDMPAGELLTELSRRYKISESEVVDRFSEEYAQCPVCTYWYTIKQLKDHAKSKKLTPKLKVKPVQMLELDKPMGDSEGKVETFVSTLPAPRSELEIEKDIAELQTLRNTINKALEGKAIPIDVEGDAILVKIDNIGDHLVDLFSIEREGSTSQRSATDILQDLRSKSSIFMPIASAMGFIAPFTICNVCGNYHVGEKYACDKALKVNDFEKLTMKAAKQRVDELKDLDTKTKKHLPNFAQWEKDWDAAKEAVRSELQYSLPLLKANLYPSRGCLNTALGQAVFSHHFILAGKPEDEFSFFDDELASRSSKEPNKDKPAPSSLPSSMFDDDEPIVAPIKKKEPEKPTMPKATDRIYQPLDSAELVEKQKVSFDNLLWKNAVQALSETEKMKVTGTNNTYYPSKTAPDKIETEHLEGLKLLLPQLQSVQAIVKSPLDAVAQVLQYVITNHGDLISSSYRLN